jgi:hypothetical protein
MNMDIKSTIKALKLKSCTYKVHMKYLFVRRNFVPKFCWTDSTALQRLAKCKHRYGRVVSPKIGQILTFEQLLADLMLPVKEKIILVS